ncbi:NAD+ diphosphatase [Tepidamorphus gemmatus]|uniref:NAD(+) diphosphatase n=1 Tax=Tepidamorphus gemmatus TaxID=747076 RepID=A0A4V2UYV4_9HYPH|nr:NAD(+) diphosphatase [Tepidamorphus gemmatus]TCT08828.1 NAD+ diphosphatase [Tepidamorphus gemmatus]
MHERSRRTGYSESLLDRAAHRRSDTAWVAAAQASGRYILFDGDRPLFSVANGNAPDPIFDAGAAEALRADRSRAIFLGLDGDVAVFAAPVTALSAEEQAGEASFGSNELRAIDVRSIAVQGVVPPRMLGPIAQAKSLLDWHARHRYCAKCGAATTASEAGYRRDCPACGAQHFPRTDPVVIMLVVDGEDCILARSPRFLPGMFSALAGFIEPGETIEEAVRREVREEVGIPVGRVGYHSSQPWPFPSSLMIGCWAEALGREIVLDTSELEAGRWFSREEVVAILAGTHPDGVGAPPRMAIAHQLLKSFVEGEQVL